MKLASVGIEDGSILAQAILVENSSQGISWRSMGDGLRLVFPKINQGESWSSRALKEQRMDNPFWENGESKVFWQQYALFIHQFLGYTPLQKERGVDIVVATENQTKELPDFADAQFISPSKALLARRLMIESDYYEGTLLVIAVCDRSTHVSTHVVRQGYVKSSEIKSYPVGFLLWYEYLLSELRQRHSEIPSSVNCLDYLDIVLEVAHQLQLKENVTFSGKLSKSLLFTYNLRRDDWQNWAENKMFQEWLNNTSKESLKDMGFSAPNQIVLGGIGTNWPVFSLLSSPTWNSTTQSVDIALGAALWSACCKRYRGFGEPAAIPYPRTQPNDPYISSKGKVPPWERHEK